MFNRKVNPEHHIKPKQVVITDSTSSLATSFVESKPAKKKGKKKVKAAQKPLVTRLRNPMKQQTVEGVAERRNLCAGQVSRNNFVFESQRRAETVGDLDDMPRHSDEEDFSRINYETQQDDISPRENFRA